MLNKNKKIQGKVQLRVFFLFIYLLFIFSVSVLKLRGGATHPKFLNTENENFKNLLTVLRSLDILILQHNHEKCKLAKQNTKDSLCEFCLIRSLIIRSNSLKGRTKINPVETSRKSFYWFEFP